MGPISARFRALDRRQVESPKVVAATPESSSAAPGRVHVFETSRAPTTGSRTSSVMRGAWINEGTRD